jgi:2-oxoisovalerate dehydrogenase E1 component subunit alpha
MLLAMRLPDHVPVQLLSIEGTIIDHPEYGPRLDLEALVDAYRHMLVARRVDTEYINLQRQGQLALYASCRGQEAIQVASVLATRPTDRLFPQYRELAAFVARGIDLASMAGYWAGEWHSAAAFVDVNVAPLCIPIATQTPHAVGWAMGARLDGSDDVAVTFLGDGATSEGDAHEAFNFAAVFDAPCVFVICNNQWAISVPVEEQTRAPSLAHKAIGYGVPGVRVDGNDVLACHSVVSEAAERARSGGGPTIIEAVTYRMEAHTTADDPSRYRAQADLDEWKPRDPIARLEAHLADLEALDDDRRAEIAAEAEAAAAATRAGAFGLVHGPPGELFEHMYSTPRRGLDEQKAQLAAEIAAGEA